MRWPFAGVIIVLFVSVFLAIPVAAEEGKPCPGRCAQVDVSQRAECLKGCYAKEPSPSKPHPGPGTARSHSDRDRQQATGHRQDNRI